MKKTIVSLALTFAASAFAGDPSAKPGEGHAMPQQPPLPMFEKMKTLVGEWKTSGDQPHTITYRLASNDSALIETIMPGSPHEMITVYHRDNDKVSMTHYCASGNQPQMTAKKLDGDKMKFDLVRVSNMPNQKKGMMMSALTMTFKDADHVVQEWTSRKDGKAGDPMTFDLTRVK
jgi:hypothetical protein